MEIISKLGIDYKLILAQVVNFLILFFVLRALIYKPLLNVLERRKNMIEKSVDDSKKIEERLANLEQDREKILSEASQKSIEILEKAKHEGEMERQKALATAKKEISGLAERYRSQLKSEKDQMFQEIKTDIASLIVGVSEKIIRKEFSKDDQKRLENAIKNEITSAKLE